MSRARLRGLFAAAIVLACGLAALAQKPAGFSDDPFRDETLPSLDEPATSDLPQVDLRLVGEIALPGPLPGGALGHAGERIAIPVAGGLALVRPEPGASVEVAAAPAPASDDGWIVDAGGRWRFRTEPGRIVAEQRCAGCRKGWKREWRLRLPGSVLSAPLPHDDQVFVGALDDRLYALRKHSGHRRWASDAGGRISNRLVLWEGEAPPAPAPDAPGRDRTDPQPVTLVLVVPDHGHEMLAFDAASGRLVTRVAIGENEGRLASVPLALVDGRVVVAHQKYDPTQAALRVYQVDVAPPAASGSPERRTAAEPQRADPRASRSLAPGKR